MTIKQQIIDLAKQHNITYVKTRMDEWAENITRLSGDDVTLDDIENLVLALQRAGKLEKGQYLNLLLQYMKEKRERGQ